MADHRRGGPDRGVSLSRFYLRRSFRIFPAFYAYFLLGWALMMVRHKPIIAAQAISARFYVTNYYQAILGDPNTRLSHTWSLAVEEQFYLLWPVAFLLLRNNRRGSWRSAWSFPFSGSTASR